MDLRCDSQTQSSVDVNLDIFQASDNSSKETTTKTFVIIIPLRRILLFIPVYLEIVPIESLPEVRKPYAAPADDIGKHRSVIGNGVDSDVSGMRVSISPIHSNDGGRSYSERIQCSG